MAMLAPGHARAAAAPLAIDKTARLEINGSAQRIRICAERTGLPPLLVVQAGPGLPVLHEARKFRQHLHLESDFLVGYWEQRGCGIAPQQDAKSVTLRQQAADLRAVLEWLRNETQQSVIVLGISLGATIALQAAEQETGKMKSVIAVSPDADTAGSDAAVYAFLQEQSALAKNRRLSARVKKLGAPPYKDSAAFQRRAALLADLGGIERGKKFGGLLRETLWGMIRTYGLIGTAKALRNMNLIQRKLLSELLSLDLLANPPHLAIPVHYVFGQQDPLTPAAIVTQLPLAIAAPESTAIRLPDAGHMAHFDQPAVVRAIALRASMAPDSSFDAFERERPR
jgi:pimeloyl-ACP methyl ester carboxylesterase